MSKISYCSLEEAWGDSYNNKINNNNNNNNFKNNNLENNNLEKCDDKYIQLNKTSDSDRLNVIKNMNNVERHQTSERNSLSDNIDEYNRYRFNNNNKVDNNDTSKNYTPFNESIEKKYLQDKLNFLENEFKKYKNIFEKSDFDSNNYQIENFSNNNSELNNSNKGNDIIDLILLLIIGLIVIFFMNSIFNIGKSIGSRNKII